MREQSCGLDVKPEVGFREGQHRKKQMRLRTIHLAIVTASLAGAMSASASLNVTFDNVSPNEVISLNGVGVYAGIYNLTVAGVATPSFCIDVYHNITGGSTFPDFNYVALDTAPNSPAGPMGATAAGIIEGLWGTYFAGATTPAEAAALQVAVWRAVNLGDHPVTLNFNLGDATTLAAYNRATVMLANLTSEASLVGLVGSVADNTQGFVVVPEPTTMIAGALLLLPFGASTLRMLRKNRTA